MPPRGISDDELHRTIEAWWTADRNRAVAARKLGLSVAGLDKRMSIATSRGMIDHAPNGQPRPADLSLRNFKVDTLPDEDAPVDEILKRRTREFERRSRANDARKLVHVRVADKGPIGIAIFGDLHIDSPGCNLPLLRSHIELVKKTPGLYAGCIGDLQDGWVGRLARLWATQGVTAKESLKLVRWYMEQLQDKLLFVVEGNHDCLDMETEALTTRGWMSYDQIRDDDLVYSIDPETGTGHWDRINGRIRRPAREGELVSIETRSLSLRCTPKHRVLVQGKTGQRRGWRFTTADKLPPYVTVPASAQCLNPDLDGISDDMLRLVGWILTDGMIHQAERGTPTIAIYQSKDGSEIERTLGSLGLRHSKHTRQRNITAVCGRPLVKPSRPEVQYRLSSEAARQVLPWLPDKSRLPEWVAKLSARQFDVFLGAIIAGDGSWVGKRDGRCAVIHGRKKFLDEVQAAAVTHGWSAFLSVAREKDWRLNLSRRPRHTLWRDERVSRETYQGDVWCLTVPLSNFLVRRNGKVHFTGNCWANGVNGISPIEWIAAHTGTLTQSDGVRLSVDLGGESWVMNARHDFRGRSQWNAAHGGTKAAMMGWRDDIMVAGHTHESGYNIIKDPKTGMVTHVLRVASYKHIDAYAKTEGFPDNNSFECPVVILRPRVADDRFRTQTITDPFLAAKCLGVLRREASRG